MSDDKPPSILIAEAVALAGQQNNERAMRGFASIREEQLAGCVATLREYTPDDKKFLEACVTNIFTTKGNLFVNVERLRLGDVLRYAVESAPVASLFFPDVHERLRVTYLMAILADDCVLKDGVPVMPLEAIRGRVIEASVGYDITRASVDHLIWLGNHAKQLSPFVEVMEARKNASRDFCEQLLALDVPILVEGLL